MKRLNCKLVMFCQDSKSISPNNGTAADSLVLTVAYLSRDTTFFALSYCGRNMPIHGPLPWRTDISLFDRDSKTFHSTCAWES